jgi:hypothetical protein
VRAFAVILVALVLNGAGAADEVAPAARSREEKDPNGSIVRTSTGEQVVLPKGSAYDPSRPIASATASGSQLSPAVALPGEGAYTLSFDRAWTFPIWGTSIGRTGMVPIDLDGDGRLEIVMGSSVGNGSFSTNNTWFVARAVPGSTEYAIVHSSGPISAGVGAVAAFRIGTRTRIFAGLGDGTLVVYDGATYAELARVHPATTAIGKVLLADADNDGQQELVVVTNGALYLLDPTTYVQQSKVTFTPSNNYYAVVDAVVGNVDADPQLEIVLANGKVLQFDGTTTTEEWDFSVFAPAAYLGLSDLDGDGMQEIVAARGWNYIDVYDADLKSPKFQVHTNLDIHALLLQDVTGDGRDEIIYGDAQWGQIHAINAATNTEIWNIPNPEHGITRIAVADVDGDGKAEVLWGAGWTSTGADYFYVYDLATRAQEFRSDDLVGPFAAVAKGDCDNDGHDEIVAISSESESGYADGIVYVFDAETFALEWHSSSSLFGRYAWTGIHDVAIGDVDGDGANEIVVGTDRLYDAAVYVIDGKTHAVKKQYFYDDGNPISAIAVADFDRDGRMDIVAGNSVEHTGSPGTYLYVIDGATGAVKWKSVSLRSSFWTGIYALEIADVSGDGAPDAVVSVDAIAVVDGVTRTVRKSASTGNVGLDVADLDGDGSKEIWVGTNAGDLARIDPVTLARTTVAHVCTGSVYSVRVRRASTLEGAIEFACGDDIGVYGAFENKVLWRSELLGSYGTGMNNNLIATDRGERALLVAGTASGAVAYQGYGTTNTDVDHDGVLNHVDNCPETANPDQADRDGDHVGDACNDANDRDGDEWANALDNCSAVPNADQRDSDRNGVGDACNDAEDRDGDEWADPIDNCPDRANDQRDRDGDVVGDLCDPYPDNPDNYRARCDEAVVNEERFGEALLLCEAVRKFHDADGDGEEDSTDACPGTPAGRSVDASGCTIGQFCTSFEAATSQGRAICNAVDWKNDEPLGNAQDCIAQGSFCVPHR